MADDDSVSGSPDRPVPPEREVDATSSDETATTESATTESATAETATAEAAGTPAGPPAAAPVLKARWRDRAWTFRAMIAVALASLVIGGVAGGVIGAAAGGDDDRGHYRMGPWGPGMQMPPGWRGQGRGFGGDGGPGWRWNDGPQQAPPLTPYGGTRPSPAPPSSSPTS